MHGQLYNVHLEYNAHFHQFVWQNLPHNWKVHLSVFSAQTFQFSSGSNTTEGHQLKIKKAK
jgi:hypothetical protein